MTDAPSPYAPGIIAEERGPPLAPGRSAVFLVAAFAMTVTMTDGLWHFWIGRVLRELGANYDVLSRVTIVGNVASSLVLLWAYLTDALPVFGTRREGYLLLTGVVTAIAWGGLGIAGDNRVVWYAVAALLGVAMGMTRAVVLGALAEIGQRRRTAAALAASYLGVLKLGALSTLGLEMLPLMFMPRSWGAGLGAGLALSVVLVVVTLGDDRRPPPAAPQPRVSIPRFLGSRGFWASLAVLSCGGLAVLPRDIVALAPAHLAAASYQIPQLRWTMPAIALAASAVYLIASRYVRLRALLRFSLLAKAIALVLIGRVVSATAAYTEVTEMLRAAGHGFAGVAFLHLAMRVAPPGREAFGTILLSGTPVVAAAVMLPLGASFGGSVGLVTAIAAGMAVLGALLVSLLPRDVQ